MPRQDGSAAREAFGKYDEKCPSTIGASFTRATLEFRDFAVNNATTSPVPAPSNEKPRAFNSRANSYCIRKLNTGNWILNTFYSLTPHASNSQTLPPSPPPHRGRRSPPLRTPHRN